MIKENIANKLNCNIGELLLLANMLKVVNVKVIDSRSFNINFILS